MSDIPASVAQLLFPWSLVDATDGAGYEESRWHTIDIVAPLVRLLPPEADVLEAGCWRGGMGVHLARTFPDRTVWLLDSFQGVQPPEDRPFPYAATTHPGGTHLATLADCELTLRQFQVRNAVIVPGWFSETLPLFEHRPLALLRFDGDSYSAIREVLGALYANVVPGGVVIVDDTSIEECRAGLWDFCDEAGITPRLRSPYYDGAPVGSPTPVVPGLWWIKGEQ